MIGVPFVILGLLLVLSALVGARVQGRGRWGDRDLHPLPAPPDNLVRGACDRAGLLGGAWRDRIPDHGLLLRHLLLVVGIGVVILGLAIEACRIVARIERRRALTDIHMPFNRADYYIDTPDDSMPSNCAVGTGILYKGTVNYADGSLTPMPLLDCVADMQVAYGLDTNDDGTIDQYHR